MIGTQRSLSSEDLQTSPVLLVCTQTESPNEITLDFLYSLFSTFGQINKILIFQRSAIIKAFIEFTSVLSAEEALKGLPNLMRDNGSQHRIKCYPSNLPMVHLNNENASAAKDYTIIAPMKSKFPELPSLAITPAHDLRSLNTMSTNDSPLVPKSFESQDLVDEELERSVKLIIEENEDVTDENNVHFDKYSKSMTSIPMTEKTGPPPKIRKSDTSLMEQWMPNIDRSRSFYEIDELIAPSFAGCYSPPLAAGKPTRVLCVQGLNTYDTTTLKIYNLFSCFGNIVKILYTASKTQSCLVEYDCLEAASLAKLYLNNLPFLGAQLKVFDSRYDTIKLKLSTMPAKDYFVGNTHTNRFRDNRPLSINPPTNTLHVSNLIKEVCNESLIALFAPYGVVEAYKFLHEEPVKNMCIVRFAFMEQAINALAALHNCCFGGRNIQISFTRSKI